jgi:hypothetical protein
MATLEEKIAQLSPELRKEVQDFIDFLLEKKGKNQDETLNFFDAVGAWEDMDDDTFSRLKEKVNCAHDMMVHHFRGVSSDSD